MVKDEVVNELEKLNNRQREAVVWLIKNFGLLKQLVCVEPIDETKAFRQAEANDDNYLMLLLLLRRFTEIREE